MGISLEYTLVCSLHKLVVDTLPSVVNRWVGIEALVVLFFSLANLWVSLIIPPCLWGANLWVSLIIPPCLWGANLWVSLIIPLSLWGGD